MVLTKVRRVTNAPREDGVVGGMAPDLVLASAAGEPFHLSESLKSGPVALFFFIHSSTPG